MATGPLRSLTPVDARSALALPLAEVPLVFVDVETTGLYAEWGDRICEVAVVVCQGEVEVCRFVSLVNPDRPISSGAAAVNGLTDALVGEAPRFAAVASEVWTALAAGLPVAHNAPFDLSFLAPELAAAGYEPPAAGALDTLALARRLLPSWQRCGLPALAALFGIRPPGGAHRALADALTTRHLLRRLLQRAGLPRRATLAELLALTGGPTAWPLGARRGEAELPAELAEALTAGRDVTIVYLSASGEETRRVVRLAGAHVAGGATYLVGYCHLRQEQRTFRLDRIRGWELVEGER